MTSTSCISLSAALLLATACTAGQPDASVRLTPLHLAARDNDVGETRRLLDSGASIEALDAYERTALHWAALSGANEVIELLLQRGANRDARAHFDETPLHWAALRGQATAVATLLQHGAAINERNLYGMTPLHEVQTRKVAELLLAQGARLDVADDLGLPPLFTAYNEDVARALMEAGAHTMIPRSQAGLATDLTVAANEHLGLVLYAMPSALRLRGQSASITFLLRNVSPAAIASIQLIATSDACTIDPPNTARTLAPAQLVTVSVRFVRKHDAPRGEHRLQIQAVDAALKPLATLQLRVDTRTERTPEDAGMIRLGNVQIRPAASRLYLLAFAGAPAIVALGWLWWRRRARKSPKSRLPIRD